MIIVHDLEELHEKRTYFVVVSVHSCDVRKRETKFALRDVISTDVLLKAFHE